MSHLYSTFAQLVSVHCKSTAAVGGLPVNQCKHNLLGYGSAKLQTLSDAQLEALDPYQREANELSKCHLSICVGDRSISVSELPQLQRVGREISNQISFCSSLPQSGHHWLRAELAW